MTVPPTPVTQESVRRQVRGWISDNWDPDASLVDWRTKVVTAGWAMPSWSVQWHGRGLPAWADGLVAAEFAHARVVGLPVGGGVSLAAPTILAHGPDALRARFLQPILTGQERWCQLFSEPGAGSDLAGITTRAERDGDEWVVSGQKVWNTSAHHADFAMLLARTDWGVPKHEGLTFFALPMHQRGVEVRPLRQMNNHASFNEVFLTEARVPADHVVGAAGDGWRVALTTLAFERRFGRTRVENDALPAGRTVVEAQHEAEEHLQVYKWYPQRAGRADLVAGRARETGRSADPLVRGEVAHLLSMQRASSWTAERARAAQASGRTPGPEGSIGKLAASVLARRAAAVHTLVAGAEGMLSGPDGPMDGLIAEILVSVPAQSIAGGTDEIQHNILGERALGLPREPVADRAIPFKDVPRNS